MLGQEGEGAGHPVAAELAVGLVDHEQPAHGLERTGRGTGDLEVERGAGGVVRGGEDHDARAVLGDRGGDGLSGEREVGGRAALGGDPAGVGVARVLGVHRVVRGEAQRRAARPAVGEQQLVHDLVRAVRGPDRLGRRGGHARLRGEILPQLATQVQRFPVRIAVQADGRLRGGGADRGGELGGGPVGVLVDVQRMGDGQLRRAVGGGAGDAVTGSGQDRGLTRRGGRGGHAAHGSWRHRGRRSRSAVRHGTG